nr:MAG TPA: hypothetical protein [Caudoviricetes sp.]
MIFSKLRLHNSKITTIFAISKLNNNNLNYKSNERVSFIQD